MMPDLLPGFEWDPRASRYRDLSTGRFVARKTILELLEKASSASEARLADLTTAAIEGRLSSAAWFREAAAELKRIHLINAALGAGGWDRLTQADYGRVGGHLRFEYSHLRKFAQDIAEGKTTLPQALNRVHMYLGNARKEFWNAERLRLPSDRPGMVTVERRMLGVAEHCVDCLNYYGQGWQPAGHLPLPGELSVCDGNCRCTLIRREVPFSEANEWIGTMR